LLPISGLFDGFSSLPSFEFDHRLGVGLGDVARSQPRQIFANYGGEASQDESEKTTLMGRRRRGNNVIFIDGLTSGEISALFRHRCM
jgi:hypothetical protein